MTEKNINMNYCNKACDCGRVNSVGGKNCTLHQIISSIYPANFQPANHQTTFGSQVTEHESPSQPCTGGHFFSPWHQSLILMKWRWSSFVSMVVNRRHPPCWRRRSALWACLPRRRLCWGCWWWCREFEMNTWKLHPKVHKLKFVEFLYEFLRKGGAGDWSANGSNMIIQLQVFVFQFVVQKAAVLLGGWRHREGNKSVEGHSSDCEVDHSETWHSAISRTFEAFKVMSLPSWDKIQN